MAQPNSTTVLADLIGSASSPVSVTTAYAGATSSALNVKDYVWALYSIFFTTNHADTTRVDVLVEESPDGTNWAPLQTEVVAAGVATLSDYVQQKATGTATGLLYTAHVPVRGERFQRISLKVDAAGSGSVSAIYVQYSLSGGPV